MIERASFVAIRMWATLAIALIAGALADAAAEYAEDLGWLGGAARDSAQQAVAPTLLAGVLLAALLVGYVAFARAGGLAAASWRGHSRLEKALHTIGGLSLSGLTVLAIEASEAAFGAPAPLGSHSVLVAHGAIVLIIFALTSIGLRTLLDGIVRAAAHAGERVSCALAAFLRRRATSPHAPIRLPLFTVGAVHLQPATNVAACGLRAPPAL